MSVIGPWRVLVPLTAFLVALIGVLTVWRIIKDKRSGFPVKDERTLRIEGKASRYTFLVGIYFMVVLMYYSLLGVEFLGWPELGALYALLSSLLVMIGAYFGFRWYFGSRADL